VGGRVERPGHVTRAPPSLSLVLFALPHSSLSPSHRLFSPLLTRRHTFLMWQAPTSSSRWAALAASAHAKPRTALLAHLHPPLHIPLLAVHMHTSCSQQIYPGPSVHTRRHAHRLGRDRQRVARGTSRDSSLSCSLRLSASFCVSRLAWRFPYLTARAHARPAPTAAGPGHVTRASPAPLLLLLLPAPGPCSLPPAPRSLRLPLLLGLCFSTSPAPRLMTCIG